MRIVSRLLAALLVAVLAGVLLQSPAVQAAPTVPRVAKPTVTEKWYPAQFTVRWRSVAGATYQVRWASVKTMRYAKSARVKARSLTIGPLNRSKTWYVQVRAIKKGKVGAWSPAARAKFHNNWPKPTKASAASIPGGIKVTWAYAAHATSYRAKFTAAAFDKWPSSTRVTTHGITSRSATHSVPTDPFTDATMTALPYGNPVFTQIETRSAYKPAAKPESNWTLAWPGIPQPASGTPVALGTYNVMYGGANQDAKTHQPWRTRQGRVADNIAARGLTVVALQEIARNDRATDGADDLVALLTRKTGNRWATAEHPQRIDPGNYGVSARIIYDTTEFRLDDDQYSAPPSGLLNDYSRIGLVDQKPVAVPYAVLRSMKSERPLMVVSAHVPVPRDGTQAQRNRSTGATAREIVTAVNHVQTLRQSDFPVVIAGDFTSNSQIFGDTSPAQPQIVRQGYWDSLATLRRSGVAHPTVTNPVSATSKAAQSGYGGRPDSIFLKGIQGTRFHANVINYPSGSTRPSDHNLVYTLFDLPDS